MVLGGSTGIGRATAVELAKRGARIIIASRNEERGIQACRFISGERGARHLDPFRWGVTCTPHYIRPLLHPKSFQIHLIHPTNVKSQASFVIPGAWDISLNMYYHKIVKSHAVTS